MSVKNQDRNEKKCVICKTRNVQRFDHFCNRCVVEHRAEALAYLNLAEPYDLHESGLRNDTTRGWW